MISMVLMQEKSSRRLNDESSQFSFIVRDRNGMCAHEESFVSSDCIDDDSSGSAKLFLMKSFRVDDSVLLNGALIIDVAIQVVQINTVGKTALTLAGAPPSRNPFGKNMLSLLHSGERADVAFRVQNTTIMAHKFILDVNAPTLGAMCDGYVKTRPVQVCNISPEVFRHVLRYIYGGEAPNARDVLRIGKDLIIAAYRFGVMGLKREVERSMIESSLDISNCVDIAIFSDEHHLPLLKEHAISYLVARSRDVLNTEAARKLKESPTLVHEIMLALAGKSDVGNSLMQNQDVSSQWRGATGQKKSSKRKQNALVQMIKRARHEKKGINKCQNSPTIAMQPELEKVCSTITESGHALDAEKVRVEARRVLEAADISLQSRAGSPQRVARVVDNNLQSRAVVSPQNNTAGSHYHVVHGQQGVR